MTVTELIDKHFDDISALVFFGLVAVVWIFMWRKL